MVSIGRTPGTRFPIMALVVRQAFDSYPSRLGDCPRLALTVRDLRGPRVPGDDRWRWTDDWWFFYQSISSVNLNNVSTYHNT